VFDNIPELPSAVGSPPYGGSMPIVRPTQPALVATPSSVAIVVQPRPLLSVAARKAAVELTYSLRAFEVKEALTTAGLWVPHPKPPPDGLTGTQKVFHVLGEISKSGSAYIVITDCFQSLNWSRPDHVLRALDAIGELLWLFELRLQDGTEGFTGTTERALRLRRLLKKEGYHVDNDAVIHPSADLLASGNLNGLRDPAAIRVVLKRINRALPDDPALAIGSAKELIEATAKTVLVSRGLAVNARDDLPELVHQAEMAVGLHPKSVAVDVDGASEVRRVLGPLTSVTDKVAALRNRFGTGHGTAALPEGLRPRHGRLAVAAAGAWCTFMLDTLADEEASWRNH
jgi:hypothetical protein